MVPKGYTNIAVPLRWVTVPFQPKVPSLPWPNWSDALINRKEPKWAQLVRLDLYFCNGDLLEMMSLHELASANTFGVWGQKGIYEFSQEGLILPWSSSAWHVMNNNAPCLNCTTRDHFLPSSLTDASDAEWGKTPKFCGACILGAAPGASHRSYITLVSSQMRKR